MWKFQWINEINKTEIIFCVVRSVGVTLKRRSPIFDEFLVVVVIFFVERSYGLCLYGNGLDEKFSGNWLVNFQATNK